MNAPGRKKYFKNPLTHPWSPILAVAILTLSLWKVKLSALRNHRDNSHVVNKILKKIKTYPGQPIPTQTYSNESKTIYSNFYDAKKYLKTQKNAQQIRQEYLQVRSDETACTSVMFVLLKSATPFKISFPKSVKLSIPSKCFIGNMVHGVPCA